MEYIDRHVLADLPSIETDPELHDHVSRYERHSHSKTCRKYKNIPCRFNFVLFFTSRTVVAEPLSDHLDKQQRITTLKMRGEILASVKEKIDSVLNPFNQDYNPNLSEAEVLSSLGISVQQYYRALSISPDSDYDLHLKRPTDSCFVNNYFIAGLKGFQANVDLQPVFNHYKCITYVCSYFTKDETECSEAIMNAAKEAKSWKLGIKDTLRKVGATFLSSREVSSQECVYN